MAMFFRYPAQIEFEIGGTTYVVSDHGREPVQEAVERIEQTGRTARGTRKRYFVADKRNWDITWTRLPGHTENTVDGFMGADALNDFYATAIGTVTMRFMNADGMYDTYNVNITDFSRTIEKRYTDDFWYEARMTIEEV